MIILPDIELTYDKLREVILVTVEPNFIPELAKTKSDLSIIKSKDSVKSVTIDILGKTHELSLSTNGSMYSTSIKFNTDEYYHKHLVLNYTVSFNLVNDSINYVGEVLIK